MSVLITGGTGKTGRRLATRLLAQNVRFRIAARHPQVGDPFDWSVRESWPAALDGVSSVYLVPPPSGDVAAMIDFIRLATDQGVRRFVLLSASLLPAGGPGAGQVHAWLRDNAAEWVVLRPSWFMQNFSEGLHRATIMAEDRIYSATADGRVAFISADDIAAVACVAITGADALNTDLILTGPAAITYDEAAAFISEALGREVVHNRISAEALAARYRERGMPAATAQILAGMDTMIAAGAEDRITPNVAAVTGVAPEPFVHFCQTSASAWAPVG